LTEEFNKSVSIIIPTRNEADTLEECLKSILAQSISPLEIIIVDGGSTDNTLEIAEKYAARIIKEGEFASPANARNLGAENAKGDVLLIMDADIMLEKNCLGQALELFKDRNVIAVVPNESNSNHSYLEVIQRKWNEGSRTPINIGLRNAKISGLVFFVRKKVFEKVRFNTAYGFGEDDDFSTRVEREFNGYKILNAENCKVISHLPHTLKELATRYMWWGRTFPAYFVKHFSLKSILNLGSLILPLAVLLLLLTLFVLPQTTIIFIIFISLFVAQILIACFRSKSVFFLQFAFFDVVRSIFFTVGLIESTFVTKKGR
jgi:glycosyltransferase involved in cell wall biosynthesis